MRQINAPLKDHSPGGCYGMPEGSSARCARTFHEPQQLGQARAEKESSGSRSWHLPHFLVLSGVVSFQFPKDVSRTPRLLQLESGHIAPYAHYITLFVSVCQCCSRSPKTSQQLSTGRSPSIGKCFVRVRLDCV